LLVVGPMKKAKKLDLKRVTITQLQTATGGGFYTRWCSNSCTAECPETLGLTNCCPSIECTANCP